jgi:hypothetical protein
MQKIGWEKMKLLKSRLKNGISNDEIISIVNLQNKWRKFLSILALIGVLGTYIYHLIYLRFQEIVKRVALK